MFLKIMRTKVYTICVLLAVVTISSCTDFWSGANQRKFHEVCVEEASDWASEEQADSYCDCVLDKMMLKYPNELDAFAHIDELAKDTDLIHCRQEILSQ